MVIVSVTTIEAEQLFSKVERVKSSIWSTRVKKKSKNTSYFTTYREQNI